MHLSIISRSVLHAPRFPGNRPDLIAQKASNQLIFI